MSKSTRPLDGLMIFFFVGGALMAGDTDPGPGSVFGGPPLVKWLIVFGAAFALSIAMAFLSKLDRKKHDEFVFSILTSSALIALSTTAGLHVVWMFAGQFLGWPQLTSTNVIGVLLMSWGFGYGWFRLRGFAG